MAAPSVIYRIGDCFGANRVEMDIANQFEKIRICVTEDVFVASLKKMADEIVPAIEVQSVALLQTLHDFGERVFSHFHQKVHVIGHQDVSAELKRVARTVVVKQLQITAPIDIGTKDPLTVVAARDYMVKRTGIMNSGFSRHGLSVITTTTGNAKNK